MPQWWRVAHLLRKTVVTELYLEPTLGYTWVLIHQKQGVSNSRISAARVNAQGFGIWIVIHRVNAALERESCFSS